MAIFQDKERLLPNFPIEQYWTGIPHRGLELKVVRSFYSDILEKHGASFIRTAQVIGPAGSGKTCTLRFFGENFAKEARKKGIDLQHVYVNLKLEGGRKVVLYRSLLAKVEPSLVSASLSAEEMLRTLVNHLQTTKKRLLLTVDETDYYAKHFRGEGLIYDLTRLNELTPQRPCGVVGVTFLARDRKFYELLDEAELSTLGRNHIAFKPYNPTEIADILAKRASDALNPGTYYDVLEFIVDVTSKPSIGGDIRYALDLLLYSGSLAEIQGSNAILPEHVRTVYSETHHAITTEDILSLPAEEKMVLTALVRALRKKRSPYASLREIREIVGVVCEEANLEPAHDVEECLQDLCDRNIADLKSLTRIGISGVPVETLDRFLNDHVRRIRSDVDKARREESG